MYDAPEGVRTAPVPSTLTISNVKPVLVEVSITIIGIGAYLLTQTRQLPQTTTYDTYHNTELGLEFTYPTGAKGYILKESTPRQDPNTYASLILAKKSDYLNLKQNPPQGGEAPPTISIAIFKNRPVAF